jgi:FkbH-like protein
VNAKINWLPKPDNLRAMARELDLGLDSFVFVDDNPAEIEIVRQFAPEVQAILLGPDPADYVAVLQNARCFEPRAITYEDTQRSEQYRAEGQRSELRAIATDLDAYLRSLEMVGIIRPFEALDAGRLSQLTQRTNQFNLTTRRRTEAEILELAARPDIVAFSFRLRDRFGDHGLVALIIGVVQGDVLEVDTWLMSCRVLNRDVEESMLNELVRRAAARGCTLLRGVYIPTAKNIMVRDLYTRLGFSPGADEPTRREWTLPVTNHLTRVSRIHIEG